MLDFFKNNTIALVLAVIGGVSGYFQGVGAAKETTSNQLASRIASAETKNEVQDTLIGEHEKADEKAQEMLEKKLDRQEAKIDALLLDRGLSPKGVVGDIPATSTPILSEAVMDKKIPLVKGVNPDGSPKNQ